MQGITAVQPAHIVIDAREYSTSTGRYVSNLVRQLEILDSVNYFSILLKPDDMPRVTFTNPRFTKVPCPHREFSFAEQLGLYRQLKNLKPDLVHFAIVNQPVLYRGRKVTTMHDLTTLRFRNPAKNPVIFIMKQFVYAWVNKRAARSSNAVITPTEFVKRDVIRYTHIDPAKVTVTYEAAEVIPDPPVAFPDLQNKEFIMYIGRPTPHKNLGRLIDAFAELQKNRPALRLVLAGKIDWNYQSHRARIERDRIPNVIFTDFISEGQLRWLYQHCGAYVFPSLSEGFGLPGLEAMVHGAPVVSSNATCLPEVYGDAALYFDPLDVGDMATKIAMALDDTILRERLIANGKQQAARYSWRQMAEQTLEIYDRVLKTI